MRFFARRFPLSFISFLLFVLGIGSREARADDPTGKRTLGVLLFPGVELLDACGPLEIWGILKEDVRIVTVAKKVGEISSSATVKLIADHDFSTCPPFDLLLIPGGFGVEGVLKDPESLAWVRDRAGEAEITMSVCNGASILAAAGLLDGRPATTNKAFWKVATAPGPNVQWVRQARWVDDGDVVTSSGVSAGMDMTLHVVGRLFGLPWAEKIAQAIEYQWQRDPDRDPFAEIGRKKR